MTSKEVVIHLSVAVLALSVFFCTVSFLAGLDRGHKNKCRYEMVISKHNPAYIAGCALTIPRYREGNK